MTAPIDHIVVVGLMGAGKSTIGQALAERLGWSWRDSDMDIAAATGLTVRELRDRDGTDAMHAREAAQLHDALAESGPNVVSAAASVIDDEASREALARPGVRTVWLRASPDVLASRFDSDAHRPAFGASPGLFLADQLAQRGPLLEGLVRQGALEIDVDQLTPDEIVARVVDDMESGPEALG
jgi:shikimate kinase